MSTLDLSNYNLTFDDEFNTRSISQTGDGTTWADIRPQWRCDANGDVGFGSSSFVDPGSGYDPFNVHDGVLTITAVPDRTASGVPGSWESGLITTQGHFSQTYGYYEVRADFSNTPGAWGAFWLLPDNQIADPNNAGNWQELDVVENYGDFSERTYSTIHTTDAAPNANWQQNLQVYSQLSQPSGYHTYGMDWEQDTISFYVDGQLMGSKPTPSDMHGPMYVLANLATQSGGTNTADPANGPISANIDYVRVYSHSPASGGTTTPSAPSDTPTSSAPGGTAGADATIGSGPDQLVLSISEDAYNGDAQYRVLVDGAQVGGIQTAHASHSAGQSDHLTVQGNWGSGTHDISVEFLNDAYGGTPTTDRNLYVDHATYDGADVNGAQHALLSAEAYHFNVDAPASSTPPPTDTSAPGGTAGADATIGSGPDHLVLSISEDAYNGDAQYKVMVDGTQVGGIQTAHASHSAGQSDHLTVQGDWGGGTHDVSVEFLNDTYGGTPTTDRNLYVDHASYNGADVNNAQHALLSAEAYHFNVDAPASSTPPPSATPPAGGTAGADATIGSGPDQLVLSISEDAYNGDAQYKVSVDGTQVGGIQTAHASHSAGQSDHLAVQGDWGSGTHDVSVEFLNDAYDGTPTTDRNLYVDHATYNGSDVNGAQQALMSAGAFHFNVDAPASSTPPPTDTSAPSGSTAANSTIGSGPDQLVLSISEDAYNGDAQYKVMVDGTQVGGIQTAQASHSAGQSDQLLVQGNWGSGSHDVSVEFLNDAYDGTATTDRNLYVDHATYNGVDVSGAQHALMSAEAFHFGLLV